MPPLVWLDTRYSLIVIAIAIAISRWHFTLNLIVSTTSLQVHRRFDSKSSGSWATARCKAAGSQVFACVFVYLVQLKSRDQLVHLTHTVINSVTIIAPLLCKRVILHDLELPLISTVTCY